MPFVPQSIAVQNSTIKAWPTVNKAIALTPDNPTLFAQRAAIERVQKAIRLGNCGLQQSRDTAAKRLRSMPSNADTYMKTRSNRIWRSPKFEKAIKISPDKSDGYNCLARSYMQSKDYDAIIREANRGIAALPSDPAVMTPGAMHIC